MENFSQSETKINLMKAFAGESQARNRYTFAAAEAKKQNLYVIQKVFEFTAEQERAHAKVFYDHLKELSDQNVDICGGYPINVSDSVPTLLKFAVHNETEEYETVYKSFAEKANSEGFVKIASDFSAIAEVEGLHAKRFDSFLKLMKENKLFVSDIKCGWMCLNCGYSYEGNAAPEVCPVCGEDKGYFIRLSLAPYTPFNQNN